MLSDRSILRQMEKGAIKISAPDSGVYAPLYMWQLQPVSVDLRLGGLSYKDGTRLPLEQEGYWHIKPGQFLLGSTLETVGINENLWGDVRGKSTLAREGLIVETAGLIDPGFEGELTLELFNMSAELLTLGYGQPICQVMFGWVDSTPKRIYGQADNHYQGQTGPTPSWRVEGHATPPPPPKEC